MVLFVEPAEVNVTEPDGVSATLVTICFSAEVNQSLDRDSMFGFSFSTTSTAYSDDFNITRTTLTIPTNFSGSYIMCVNITILNDTYVEPTETIEYEIIPLFSEDSVIYSDGGNSLRVNIFDNDGTYVRA